MNKRDYIGLALWFIVAVIFGIIVLPVMVLREYWQWKYYLKPCNIGFEWWDIIRYTIVICTGALTHWCLLDQFFPMHQALLNW